MISSSKIFLITGANSGIGYETALALAKTGGEILMFCRNKNKGEEAQSSIIFAGGNENVHLFIADLSSQKQIREVADKILNRFNKIDVLINNAACITSPLQWSEDGIELQFAVNHLAPFLLTHLLLPALKNSTHGRIINVSSRAHRTGNIHFDDVNLQKKYSSSVAYNQSKLANILFTYELASRLSNTNITVNCMYPGLVNTAIGNKNTDWKHKLFWQTLRHLGVSPAEGARTIIYLATSTEVENVSGKYFGSCVIEKSSALSNDKTIAKKLWTLSEEMTGLKQKA